MFLSACFILLVIAPLVEWAYDRHRQSYSSVGRCTFNKPSIRRTLIVAPDNMGTISLYSRKKNCVEYSEHRAYDLQPNRSVVTWNEPRYRTAELMWTNQFLNPEKGLQAPTTLFFRPYSISNNQLAATPCLHSSSSSNNSCGKKLRPHHRRL